MRLVHHNGDLGRVAQGGRSGRKGLLEQPNLGSGWKMGFCLHQTPTNHLLLIVAQHPVFPLIKPRKPGGDRPLHDQRASPDRSKTHWKMIMPAELLNRRKRIAK
eukprot:3106384-Prorocentrum_lima.AAC.1